MASRGERINFPGVTEAAFLATLITLELVSSMSLDNATSWRLGDLEGAITGRVLASAWAGPAGPRPLRIRLVELEADNMREHHLRQRAVPLHRSPWMFGLDRSVIRVELVVEARDPITGALRAMDRYRGRTAWEPDLDRELAYRGSHRPYAGYLVADASGGAGALAGDPAGRSDGSHAILRAVENALSLGPSGGR